MKNRIYSVIFLLMILAGYQPCYAAFPANAPVSVIDRPDTSQTSVIVDAPTRAQRMQASGRNATAMGAGFGIAALCCGIAGLFVAGIPLGVCAIVFGAIGANRRLKGLAIAGLTLGVIDVIGALIVLSTL